MITHHVGRLCAVGLAVGGQPVVHPAIIPRGVLSAEGMAGGGMPLGVGFPGVEMEWQQITLRIQWIGLVKNRAPVRQSEGGGVVKTTDTRHGAKVVIERAVL